MVHLISVRNLIVCDVGDFGVGIRGLVFRGWEVFRFGVFGVGIWEDGSKGLDWVYKVFG